MSDTINTGLDAIQLAALRKCDDVAFYHHEGKSYIRAIKRVRQSEAQPFAQDVVVEIPCATRWNDYSQTRGISWPVPSFQAFEMVGNYSESCWQTTAGMLRKGDELTLEWSHNCFGCDSDLVRAGFQLDRLTLCVARGAAKLRFHVDDSVCPVTSTARMIRNVRPAPEYRLTTQGEGT